jgi:ribosomal protein L40E
MSKGSSNIVETAEENDVGEFVGKRKEKANYCLVGGVLSIIAAFISLLLGIVFIIRDGVPSIMPAIFGVVAFVFGLWGGMLSLRKQNYSHAVIGAWFPLLEGVIIILTIGGRGIAAFVSLIVAAPVIAFSLLSMILITESKTSFSQIKSSLLLTKKYCRHCGAENKTDADFCERCGKSFA